MAHFVALLLLLSILIVVVKAGGAVTARLGQPAVFGELVAGLVLGPTVLNVMQWPPFTDPNLHLHQSVRDFAELGVILLMFIAGLETELDQLRRVGRASLAGATGGVILPFFGGWALAEAFGFSVWESVFIGTVLTATSVSISVQTLLELGRLQSKEGMTILGAAVIDDVLGVLLLSVVVALGNQAAGAGGAGLMEVALVLGKMAVFFLMAVFLGRYFQAATRWASGVHEHQVLLTFALIALLLYSWAAEALGGVAAITGAYVAGLMLTRTTFRQVVEDKVKVFSYALFVPVFLASIGMEANAREVEADVTFAVVISLLAILAKVVGSGLGTLAARFNPVESLRVGVGMVSRGEVALIIATIGLDRGVIGRDVFATMIVMTLATTLVTPVLLRWAFRLGTVPNQPLAND